MSFAAVGIAASSPLTFDLDEFARQLETHWPGTQLSLDRGITGLFGYALPPVPLDATLDPAVPGGLRWLPVLRPDLTRQPPGWRLVSAVQDDPVRYVISPDHKRLWIEGGTVLDCAVAAVWLRGWLPPSVPLDAMLEEWGVLTPLPPRATVATVARLLLEANARQEAEERGMRPGDPGHPRPWHTPRGDEGASIARMSEALGLPGLPRPRDAAAEWDVESLARQMLGDEADLFFPPR